MTTPRDTRPGFATNRFTGEPVDWIVADGSVYEPVDETLYERMNLALHYPLDENEKVKQLGEREKSGRHVVMKPRKKVFYSFAYERPVGTKSAPPSLAQRAVQRMARRGAGDTAFMKDAMECGYSRLERAARLLPTDLRDDYLVTMRDVLQTESATASSPMEVTRIAQRLVFDIVDVAYRNSTHQPERDIMPPGRSLLKPISVAALMGAIAALSLLSNIIQVVELHPAGTILIVIILALIASALGGATIERNRRRRLP